MLRSPFFLVVPVLGALLACGYGDHEHDGYYDDNYGTCSGPIRESNIDADLLLDVQPGSGVGVFVEYASGGHWHVYVSCDTEKSTYACSYNVIVQPVGSSPVLATAPENLESDDKLTVATDYVELAATTDYDLDGFYIDTDPGVTLNIEAYLDNQCTDLLYWSGDGAVHSGAPSMPLDLVPIGEQTK